MNVSIFFNIWVCLSCLNLGIMTKENPSGEKDRGRRKVLKERRRSRASRLKRREGTEGTKEDY